MPMIVTDPALPDNPVVFANDAFCRLTGYARAEIVGRNCRFLQGPGTDPQAIARIRAAVAAGQALEIELCNYRKTGEPFWNRLMMAPVRDETGCAPSRIVRASCASPPRPAAWACGSSIPGAACSAPPPPRAPISASSRGRC
jgi:PAS domain S-box-containing protein